MYKYLLHIDGMMCGMCEAHVNDLIRKDCVWFTEKGKDGASTLYSLAEFAGLNKLRSLQRAYRGGRFGATPNI